MGSFFVAQGSVPVRLDVRTTLTPQVAEAPAASAAETAPAAPKEDYHMRVRIIETAQKGEGMGSFATYKIQTKVHSIRMTRGRY